MSDDEAILNMEDLIIKGKVHTEYDDAIIRGIDALKWRKEMRKEVKYIDDYVGMSREEYHAYKDQCHREQLITGAIVWAIVICTFVVACYVFSLY